MIVTLFIIVSIGPITPFMEMKDALHLTALHAFGIGASCDNLHLLGLPDEHGSCKEHVLHSVGQHIALLRVEDGEMKVLTGKYIFIKLNPF